MPAFIFRKVQDSDREAILCIFNYFVENSYAAYPDRKVGTELFDMLRGMSRGGVFYVIESSAKQVIGFGLLRHHQHSDTFKHSAEVTYFILPEFNRQGLGTKLLNTIMEDAKNLGVRTLLANISSLNIQSLNFHRRQGFRECGRFESIGNKFDKDFDVIWMQKFI